MKKIILFINLIIMFTLSFAEQGGYTGPSETNRVLEEDANFVIQRTSVVKAKKLPDDSYVTLQGNIVQHLYKDKYLFQDKTGKINIEVDHDKWQGLSIGAKDLVEIYGEVDRDKGNIEIDVKSIRKI